MLRNIKTDISQWHTYHRFRSSILQASNRSSLQYICIPSIAHSGHICGHCHNRLFIVNLLQDCPYYSFSRRNYYLLSILLQILQDDESTIVNLSFIQDDRFSPKYNGPLQPVPVAS